MVRHWLGMLVAASVVAGACTGSSGEEELDGPRSTELLTSSTTSLVDEDRCAEVLDQLRTFNAEAREAYSSPVWSTGATSEGPAEPPFPDPRLTPRASPVIDNNKVIAAQGEELLVFDLDDEQEGPTFTIPHGLTVSYGRADMLWVDGSTVFLIGGDPGNRPWPSTSRLDKTFPAVTVIQFDLDKQAVTGRWELEGYFGGATAVENGVQLSVRAPFGPRTNPEPSMLPAETIESWTPKIRTSQDGDTWSEPVAVAACETLTPSDNPDATYDITLTADFKEFPAPDRIELVNLQSLPNPVRLAQGSVGLPSLPTFHESSVGYQLSGDRILAAGIYELPDKLTFQAQLKILADATDTGSDTEGFITTEPAALQPPLAYDAASETFVTGLNYLDSYDPPTVEFLVFDVTSALQLRGVLRHDLYHYCVEGDIQRAYRDGAAPEDSSCRTTAGFPAAVAIDNDRIVIVTDHQITVHTLDTLELVTTKFYIP